MPTHAKRGSRVWNLGVLMRACVRARVLLQTAYSSGTGAATALHNLQQGATIQQGASQTKWLCTMHAGQAAVLLLAVLLLLLGVV